jgi:hypothetical protein
LPPASQFITVIMIVSAMISHQADGIWLAKLREIFDLKIALMLLGV